MNDDELTRLFRSLDEPADPRAAFATADRFPLANALVVARLSSVLGRA